MTAVHPSDQSVILSKKSFLSPIILYRSLHQPLQAILSEGGGVSAGAIDTTYLLGNIVTVNGLFIGIINFTQIDMTNTVNTNGKNFDLVAINGDKIIFGDAEGALDASNEAKRPTQLFGQTFTKQ
jgi:hypothetical protein